ncbi:MAG: protein kinase domain-containing protein [Gemmatimonadaceae bacterium]
MIGSTIGNHRIVEKLGDGGMGTVYRAVDQMLDREVAVKVLRPELTSQPALSERFRSEAIAMARVSHPNIAMLHGLERHGNDLYMIMEYVRGETLEHVVQRAGKLSWRRTAEILTSVLDALDHAHDMGVVHRDIKPANIMLTRNGVVKVMDFGIARMVGRTRQTQFGHAVGTPSYMAPEQLRGEDVDGRTDLYAVGAALFELVTGRMAFEADSDYKLMMMQLNDPPPSPSSIQSDVPPAIDRIVLCAMEKKAENRFPSAAAFRNALQDALRGAPPTAAEVVRPSTPVPATRFADQAVPVPPPPVSIAEAPATRLAEPERTSGRGNTRPLPATDEHPRTTLGKSPRASLLDGLSPGARDRLRDWRTWAIAASLFVSAGMLALAFKRSRGVAERNSTDSSAQGAPNASSTIAANVTRQDTTESSGVTIAPQPDQTPPQNRIESTPPPSQVVPEPRRPLPDRNRDRPRLGGGGGRPGGGVIDPSRSVDTMKTAPPADPPKEVRVADPLPTEPEETGESARAAIMAGIAAFASAVNSGSVAEVDRLLRGPERPRSNVLTMVREGRLTMSAQPEGAPSIGGGEASVPFEARLSWRTPFGSVRRNTMPMMAEFSRSGRTWRLNSVRMLRPVDLR